MYHLTSSHCVILLACAQLIQTKLNSHISLTHTRHIHTCKVYAKQCWRISHKEMMIQWCTIFANANMQTHIQLDMYMFMSMWEFMNAPSDRRDGNISPLATNMYSSLQRMNDIYCTVSGKTYRQLCWTVTTCFLCSK